MKIVELKIVLFKRAKLNHFFLNKTWLVNDRIDRVIYGDIDQKGNYEKTIF